MARDYTVKIDPNASPAEQDRIRKLRQQTASSDTDTSNIAVNVSGIATNVTGIANNATDIATNAANIATNASDIDALETLADGKIYVGNVSNVATEVTPSGDVTMTNAGVTAIGADKVKDTMIDWGEGSGQVSASDVPLQSLNADPAKSVQRWFDHTQAAGYYSGGDFTDAGGGNLTVAAGDGIIKATNVIDAVNLFFMWEEDTITDLDEGTNYIWVAYDATTPSIEHSTTKPTDVRTNIMLGKVFKEGTGLHLFNSGMYIPELGKNVLSRFVQEFGEISRTSGGVISETGTLNIASTDAVVWGGLTRNTTTGIDTSEVGVTFEYYYYDSSDWQYSDESAIDSANYNNIVAGTVTAVGTARYGVHWVYIDADGHIMVVYGQDSYKLDEAQAAQPPSSLPDHIVQFAWLAAKIIVAKDAVVFTEIASAYDIQFTSQTTGIHNDLGGLQGGAADDYQHLTTAQVAEIAANTLKETNVSTALSTGTVNGTSYGITSDGGVDDVVLAQADTDNAGVLSAAKWNEIVANTAKETNVSTDLSEGTATETTVDVNSSDGDNATLVSASTIRAGLLTKAKFDEIVANTLKETNTLTNITVVEAPTNVEIQSSDGANDTIAAADATNAGVMTKAMYDEHVVNNAKVTNATHTGEVTGSGELTVADNIIDEANLKLDESPTNDYVLTADSSKSGGMKWAESGSSISFATAAILGTL